MTRNGRPVAVLMSADDLAALEDTLELLSDPTAMADIAQARLDVVAGNVVSATDLRAKYVRQCAIDPTSYESPPPRSDNLLGYRSVSRQRWSSSCSAHCARTLDASAIRCSENSPVSGRHGVAPIAWSTRLTTTRP